MIGRGTYRRKPEDELPLVSYVPQHLQVPDTASSPHPAQNTSLDSRRDEHWKLVKEKEFTPRAKG